MRFLKLKKNEVSFISSSEPRLITKLSIYAQISKTTQILPIRQKAPINQFVNIKLYTDAQIFLKTYINVNLHCFENVATSFMGYLFSDSVYGCFQTAEYDLVD